MPFTNSTNIEIMKYRDYLASQQKTLEYEWITVGDLGGQKHIAMIATSGGVEWNEVNKQKFLKRVAELNKLGFVVHVPRYGQDDSANWIFEPGEKIAAAVGAKTTSRAVSPQNGAGQIIECAENGWDVFPYMGGMSFVDKIGEVVKYFKRDEADKPSDPIRFFNFSDCTYAADLQSHHPDIFRYYETTTSGDLWYDSIDAANPSRAEYDEVRARNLAALKQVLTSDEITSYRRAVCYSPTPEINLEDLQYFPLHNDMIWHMAVDFDAARVGGANVGEPGHTRLGFRLEPALEYNKLNTSRPYILGLEGFLQQAAKDNIYDTNFVNFLDEFLAKRQAEGELPKAIEMGLFETRIDGSNGYADGASRLHDEQTGLIKIDDFNIDRLMAHRKQIAQQIQAVSEAKPSAQNNPTSIPQEIIDKVKSGAELEKGDIAKILEGENNKILHMQKQIIHLGEKYGVPVITNNRNGHCLNIGVVGGGLVNLKIRGDVAEIEQLPTNHRITPKANAASASIIRGAQKEEAISASV